MAESVAKEYIYSNSIKITPEKIEIDDKKFQENIYSYFSKDNIMKFDDDYHNFKPVISAQAFVSQIDPFKLKIIVLLTNDKRNWYLPRFEEKSVYSEKKIYLIGSNNKILNAFPEWWPSVNKGLNSPSVYIPRPEHIELFAKFNKGDKYKIEYIIDIPDFHGDQISFNLFYQDYAMPYDEVFNKYSELHNSSLPELTTKSNIVKLKCKKISQNKLDGYICDI